MKVVKNDAFCQKAGNVALNDKLSTDFICLILLHNYCVLIK